MVKKNPDGFQRMLRHGFLLLWFVTRKKVLSMGAVNFLTKSDFREAFPPWNTWGPMSFAKSRDFCVINFALWLGGALRNTPCSISIPFCSEPSGVKWHGWSQLIDLVPEETSPRLPPLPVEEYSPQFAKSYPKIMTSHPGFFFFSEQSWIDGFFLQESSKLHYDC